MKKNRKNLTERCAAIALALPLTLVGSAALEAKPLPLPTTTQTTGSQLIADVRQINPTTVEVIYADGKMMMFDFYGPNIVRIFRDDNGGILRDPKAKPAAQILTANARRATGGVTVRDRKRHV